jgi:hypothetical protein
MKLQFLTTAIFFTATLAFAQPQAPTGGVSVKPVRLFYTLMNGEKAIQTVYVINNTSVNKQYKLYLQDWERDTLGAHNYLPKGEYVHSCANWVSINKDFVEVKAGESQEILVKLTIPDSLSAINEMKWTMLFIEDVEEKVVPSKDTGFRTMVQNITRIGVHIVQTPNSLKEKDVKLVSFEKKKNATDEYRIICKNTGKIQFDCNCYIELSSIATGEKTVIKKNLFPLFPNQVRYADFILPPTLAKGKYTIVAVVDGGDDIALQASESTIEVK